MTAARLYRLGLLVNLSLAAVCLYFARTIPPAARVDFDVIGVLWLLESLPILVAYALAVLFGALAVYCAVRLRFPRG